MHQPYREFYCEYILDLMVHDLRDSRWATGAFPAHEELYLDGEKHVYLHHNWCKVVEKQVQ